MESIKLRNTYSSSFDTVPLIRNKHNGFINTMSSNSLIMKTLDHSVSCEECGCNFNSESHLSKHRKSHDREKLFVCSECQVSSVSKTKINAHIKSYHSNSVTANVNVAFNCVFCEEQFVTHELLTDHYRSYHSEYNGISDVISITKLGYRTLS